MFMLLLRSLNVYVFRHSAEEEVEYEEEVPVEEE